MTKGQLVKRKVEGGGWSTEDLVAIERIDEKGVWLASELGEFPAGPFDPTTGEFLGVVRDARVWIEIAALPMLA
jgi:hypothetical protein